MSDPTTSKPLNSTAWQRILAAPLVALVVIYQWTLSPVLHWLAPGGGCRFVPSCSEYALQALRQHGAFSGGWLALKRIARCHPWGGFGADPVPSACRCGQSAPHKHN